MAVPIIQAEYPSLAAIAQRFTERATFIESMHGGILRQAQQLEQGWEGRGAAAFFHELDSQIYPALTRLNAALAEASQVTLQISQQMRAAEEAAANVYRSGAAPTVAAARTAGPVMASMAQMAVASSSVPFSRTLSRRDGTNPTGPDVSAVQRQLIDKGLLGGEADGVFGPQTEAAVKEFQSANGLEDDGVVGPKTWGALFGTAPPQPNPSSGANAILGQLTTTGASAQTARQDRIAQGGPDASRQMAQTDLGRVQPFAERFRIAGEKHDLPPALLAAIASRETRGGNLLDSQGFGDHGNGFGLMQVDKRFHTLRGFPDPYSTAHLDQAAEILKNDLNTMQRKFPDWSPEKQLRAAVAAYNAGASTVQTYAGMDIGTTGDDYSADVWTRAQYYAEQGI